MDERLNAPRLVLADELFDYHIYSQQWKQQYPGSLLIRINRIK